MVYGYIRVSTDKQTCENQKLAIKEYCRRHRLHHVQWVSETISGTKMVQKRKLGGILNQIETGDILICTELSRLGRSMIMILDVLNYLLEKDVKVYAIKENYELGDNIQSQVLAFAFGLTAQIERQLLSERTKLGLERARREGKQIGRRLGQKPTKYKLSGKKTYINRRLKEGQSKNSLAKELGVTWVTLDSFIKNNRG